MKYLIMSLSILLLSGCVTTPPPKPVDPVQKVIEAKGTKAELYTRTMDWMVKNFVSAKSVIQYQDKDAGVITGKGSIKVRDILGIQTYLSFIFKFEIKDGKLRVTADQIEETSFQDVSGYGTKTTPEPVPQKDIDDFLMPLFSGFQKAVNEQQVDF